METIVKRKTLKKEARQAKMMLLTGKILETESGLPVVGIRIRAYDKDLLFDDLLGNSVTDNKGNFNIEYSKHDYQEIFEGKPEIHLNLYAGPRILIDSIILDNLNPNIDKEGNINVTVKVDRNKLGSFAPIPPEGFPTLNKNILNRKEIKAKTNLPEGVNIELDRIWLKDENQIELNRQKDGSYTLVRKFDLQLHEPPAIEFEELNKEILNEKFEKEIQGFLPDHLGVKFSPFVIKDLMQERNIEDDSAVNVFSPDTRYVFRDTSFPWCTTGRVETPAGIGSGTMIGRNLLLTASHCIDWGTNSVGWVKFTPSYYNGSAPFGISWGTRVVYWNRAIGGLSDFETAFDYVVVVLDRNMGNLTGYAGYRTYSPSWNNGNFWQTIGYPGDLTGTERPAFFGGGAIWNTSSHSTSGRQGLVLGHFMDITGGHSGGPVWGWWGNEPWPRVVGVQSAESNTPGPSTAGDNEAGGGDALSALISWARSHY